MIDLHTHLLRFSDLSDGLKDTLARHNLSAVWDFDERQYLGGTAVANKVVVFGLKAKKTGFLCSNEYVYDFVKKNSEKYVYFASIDPGEDGYMEDLAYNHKRLGCRGVKIGPIYQGVHPCDARYYDIYGYCERHGLPVITHMATTFTDGVPLEYARPCHMDQVACDFPGLIMVLAHMGHPWEGETLAVIRRHENVWADVSALYYRPWQFYNSMRLAVEYNCHHKLLFGSDFPATTTEGSVKGLRGVNSILGNSRLPPIPGEVIEGIIQRDQVFAL